jgi:hypothetical protein
MQALLDHINADEDRFRSLEVEVRLMTTPRKAPKFVDFRYSTRETAEFAKALINQAPEVTMTQTANFLTNVGSSTFIKRLTFINGVQDKSLLTYQLKTPFTSAYLTTKSRHLPDAKLSMAFEEPTTKENAPKHVDLVRFKRRYTMTFDSIPNWHVDITLVKVAKGTNAVAALKRMRDGLFGDEDDAWKFADQIEIEAERDHARNIQLCELRLIDTLANMTRRRSLLGEVAKYMRPLRSNDIAGFKQLGNAVIELTRGIFAQDLQPYLAETWVTDKADGVRAFVLFGHETRVITAAHLDGILIDGPTLDREAVADAEYLEKTQQVYIFDMIAFDGHRVTQLPFEERMALFDKVVGGRVHAKKFVQLTGKYAPKIDAALARHKKEPYDIDGLIFTRGGSDYYKTQNFKWKPLEKMTIDFLLRECPKSLINVAPYIPKKGKTLYFLFSYINSKRFETLGLRFVRKYKELFPDVDFTYFPIQFAPSSNPFAYLYWGDDGLDGHIVELGYVNNEWKYYRTRHDKSHPNDFRIAELTYYNYFNPLTLEDIKSPRKGYFQIDDNKEHEGTRHFNSFVKSRILQPYEGAKWVIDMAGGKGQDLFRYARVKVQNIIFLEKDKDGISEIIRRKHTMKHTMKDSINIHTVELDLTDPHAANIDKIEAIGLHLAGRVPLIVCNFAIHYLVGTGKQVANLISLITHFLAPGGRFMYTAFDGKTVFDLLKPTGKWEVHEGEAVKYSIVKDYRSDQLTSTNQKIKVRLPFSGGEYYTEYLVNNKYLEGAFKKAGMRREAFDSFAVFLKEYAKKAPAKYAQLTDDDKKFVSLYYFVSYFKPA